jgi:hypothetical protein
MIATLATPPKEKKIVFEFVFPFLKTSRVLQMRPYTNIFHTQV